MSQTKILLVGLGNKTLPNTRHNVGMMNTSWKSDTTQTILKILSPKDELQEYHVTFLKPRKFMNISGSCVAQAVKDLSIPLSNLYIFHDDMQRDLSKIMRIGIGRPPADDRSHDVVADYVLNKFTEQELDQLQTTVFPMWTRDHGLEQLMDTTRFMAFLKERQKKSKKAKKKKDEWGELHSLSLTRIKVVGSFKIMTREKVTCRWFFLYE
ncbi:peptidyl-tRNA hydrolase [Rhizopus microsporus var. microsporus]|uniref:Peptidyl-tRNA hydrolase n=1 Tax=Rhizopus microsporus var. microsporus TaxID=86635 RepID=A0A1X0RI16_RHIZD|nr:peptidyl-tRNA hydrolase [Rhizopus microsporus var. microsporus]